MSGTFSQQLREILEQSASPALTITMRSHRTMPDAEQDPIRFKNLLKDAEGLVHAHAEADDALLDGARRLLDDRTFWQHQDHGLAYLASGNNFQVLRVPLQLEEYVGLADRYAMRPFLPLLEPAPTYFVLAAAYDNVRLMKGWRFGVSNIEIDSLPAGYVEYLDGAHLTANGTPPPKFGNRRLSDADASTEMRELFSQDLARLTQEFMTKQNNAWLILIADENLAGEFAAAYDRDDLIRTSETHVTPANMDQDTVHEIAWKAVNDHIADHGSPDEKFESFQAHYKDGASDQGITDPHAIARAAIAGRVDALFVSSEAELQGDLDHETGKLDEDSEGDAIDDLIHATMMQGGDVEMRPSGDMPTDSGTAALLRY